MAGVSDYMLLSEEERKRLAGKTQQDYEQEAIARNWATAQPGSRYFGWNGGSVTGEDIWQAGQDSIKYDYDLMLDPRNNGGARDAIGSLLLDVSEKANADAVAGIGDYDTNRQNYLNQIGWTDYQNVFKNLQETGSLGLTTLDGQSIEEKYGLGNPNWMSNEQWAAYEKEMAPIWAEQQAQAEAMAAQQAYIQSHLSPLMNGQAGGQGGAWGYDMEQDPVWQAYLKQYSRAADKGMNDTLAQLSARTGGMASSYAGQVAQQTHNDIMQGATDMIPQLEQQAYERDLTERQMAIDAEQEAYERQVAAEQQAYERQIYAQQLAADQQAQNANLLLSLMESYGYQPSDAELAAAGLGRGMADAIGTAYQNNLALQWAKANKTSGGGDEQDPETLDYIRFLNEYGAKDYNTALLALLSQGVDEKTAATAADAFAAMMEGQETETEPAPWAMGNLPEAQFNEMILRLDDYLNNGSEGRVTAAMNYVERIWDDLSDHEKQIIFAMFDAAGYPLTEN